METKIKSHGDTVTYFYDFYSFLQLQTPKVDSSHTYLAVIRLDPALKKDDNYYLQVFLKECKYIEKKVVRHIYDNLRYPSSSNELDECDEEQLSG